MDVALGVVVTDDEAQIELSDAAAPHPVIDRLQVDLTGGGIDELVSTVLATDRMLTDTGHRLVATRVDGHDADRVNQVVGALGGALGLTNVDAVSPPEGTAATAQVSTGMSPTTAQPVDSADPSMTMLSPQGPQLAYSEVADDGTWAPDQIGEPYDVDDLDADAERTSLIAAETAARPRALLVGSTVAGAMVVGFAALAVAVAIGVRPTVSEQAIRTQDGSVPGNYFPNAPGQGVKRDAENWTVVEHLPPPGAQPTVRTFEPKSLTQPLSNAGPRIDMYPDGTFGVRDAAVPLPTVPIPNPVGGVDPVTQLLVSRLIPDFSQYTPTDVLYSLSNLAPVAAVAGTTALTSLITVTGTTLAQLGTLVAVSPLQGALFATDVAAANVPFNPATVTTAIPQQLFSATITPEEKSALLPAGITAISDLPDTGSPDPGVNPGLSTLSAPITNPDSLTPTLVGTGPEVVPATTPPVFPELIVPKPDSTEAPADVPSTELPADKPGPSDAPGQKPSPAENTPPGDTPAEKPVPSDAPEEKPSPADQTPPADTPADKPAEKPSPAEKTPPGDTPAVTPPPPIVYTEHPVPTDVPIPEEKPAPVQQAPVPKPVPVQEVPAQKPGPVQEVPAQKPAPVQRTPVEKPAPVQRTPVEKPAPAQPAAPKGPSSPGLQLPDLGGLFG